MKKKGNAWKKPKKKWDHNRHSKFFEIGPCVVCNKIMYNDSSFVKMCQAKDIPNYKTYCYECYRKV